MESTSGFKRQDTPYHGAEYATGNGLGFVCQVLQQYISILTPENRPFFVACVGKILNDALKPSPSVPTMYSPTSTGESLERFMARQREFGLGEPGYFPSPYGSLPEALEPPTDNIAFRTIPCRNWIKFKGNCRLGGKCRFIHDPAFISLDEEELGLLKSPAPHCWSYIQGTCHKGPQCKYYHPPSTHLSTYQRYTPCREWDGCIRPACSFRHAPVIVGNVSDPFTTLQGFEEQPLLSRNEIQNPKDDLNPGVSSTPQVGNGNRNGLGHAHHTYHHHPSPTGNLDTIHEELGSVNPTLPNLASTRRRSIGPNQLGHRVEDLESPLLDSSSMRPRGKSFDIAFMLPTKRDRAQQDSVRIQLF